MELDDNVGRVMEAIRSQAVNTIVILTADNGAWQDAYPDAGPFRGEKGTAFEAGWRVPGIMADVAGDPNNPALNVAWKYVLGCEGQLARC